MARNVEIKARATDYAGQLERASNIATYGPDTLVQTDTFFNTTHGRLKLREFPNQDAQLIFYHRADQSGPKLSSYHITNTPDAEALKLTLSETLGTLAVVEKTRTLYLVGRTRLHFDKVKGLGEFIELEVVLADEDTVAEGESEAQNLMQQLNIQQADLVPQAYVDLLKRTT